MTDNNNIHNHNLNTYIKRDKENTIKDNNQNQNLTNNNNNNNNNYNNNNYTSPYELLSISEKNHYKSKHRELNLLLSMNGFKELEDLFDSSFSSVIRTLKIFSTVMEDRQKLFDQKADLIHKLNKIENEHFSHQEKNDNFNQKINELNNKIEFYKNKIILQEKKADKDIEKHKKDKEDANRAYSKIIMKESHYKCEIKKLESILDDTKSKLKKYMNDNKEIKIVENKNERILINNNNVVFDNFLKNSPSIILNQVNYSRDFYELIFKSSNEKIKQVNQENHDLRNCLKILRDEIIEYIDMKKRILIKYSQKAYDVISKENNKDFNSMINSDVFNLDIDSSSKDIFEYFKTILNSFRFLLIYDIYDVSPDQEFNYEEIKNTIKNNKYSVEKIPYYSKISNIIDNLNLESLEDVKNKMESALNKQNDKRNNDKKNSMDLGLNIPEGSDNYLAENLDELEDEINNNCNNFEEQYKGLEDDIMEQIKNMNEYIASDDEL